MHMQKIFLPYSVDIALDYFNTIADQPWAMLLYSGNATHRYNRFDIIVADPITTIETRSNITKVNRKNKEINSKLDPFEILKNEIKQLNITCSNNCDLPFQGGALGIWAYDLNKRIEILPKQTKKGLSFPDMAIGIYLWALIVDHHKKAVILLSYHNVKQRLFWLQNQIKKTNQQFKICEKWQSNMSKQEYFNKISQIHHFLHNGDCYQINLAQRFKTKYYGNEWEAFLKLNKYNHAPFSAFIRLKHHCVLSMSPERFLWLHKNLIQTRPIKGTLPRKTDEKKDKQQVKYLQSSVKNLTENIMIVDLLRNDIGKVAIPGTVNVPELFIVETFSAVYHLVSTIVAKLATKYDAIDLLKACFPGGSVTGVPKIRSMEIIDKLEPHKRNIYCGAIGYVSLCGSMDTNISIRTLLTENQYLYCWSGGGIIADSKAEKEYQEIFDKLSTILSVLDNA